MQNPREGSAWISRLTLQSTETLSCSLLLPMTQLLSPGHPSPSENQSWLGFSVPAWSSWARRGALVSAMLDSLSQACLELSMSSLTWHLRIEIIRPNGKCLTGKGPTSLTINCLFFRRLVPERRLWNEQNEQALTRIWKWHHWLENTVLSKGIILNEQQQRASECLPQWGLSVHHHFCQTWAWSLSFWETVLSMFIFNCHWTPIIKSTHMEQRAWMETKKWPSHNQNLLNSFLYLKTMI